MAKKMFKVCSCKDCKVALKAGKVLGVRKERSGTWRYNKAMTEGYMVSDYIAHPKFKKGRRPDVVA